MNGFELQKANSWLKYIKKNEDYSNWKRNGELEAKMPKMKKKSKYTYKEDAANSLNIYENGKYLCQIIVDTPAKWPELSSEDIAKAKRIIAALELYDSQES